MLNGLPFWLFIIQRVFLTCVWFDNVQSTCRRVITFDCNNIGNKTWRSGLGRNLICKFLLSQKSDLLFQWCDVL